jgi:hypothetical protein
MDDGCIDVRGQQQDQDHAPAARIAFCMSLEISGSRRAAATETNNCVDGLMESPH